MDLQKTAIALGLLVAAAIMTAFHFAPDQADPERTVFRVSYENHAWVFQKSACEIRADGRILEIEFSDPPDRITGYREIGRLAADDIDRMAELLPIIAAEPMSEPRQVMADFGAIALSGFDGGQPVPLKIWGDWSSERRSADAAVLIKWLASAFPESCPS